MTISWEETVQMNKKNALTGLVLALMISAIGASVAKAAAETRLRAQLAGAAIANMVPKGRAEFRSRATSQLTVQVEGVNLADGTTLHVLINNGEVGTITLTLRRGEMQLNTGDGAVLPPIG